MNQSSIIEKLIELKESICPEGTQLCDCKEQTNGCPELYAAAEILGALDCIQFQVFVDISGINLDFASNEEEDEEE